MFLKKRKEGNRQSNIKSIRRLSSNDIQQLAAFYASTGDHRISYNIDGLKTIAYLMPIYLVEIKDESKHHFQINRIQTEDLLVAKKLYDYHHYDCIINHIPYTEIILSY